MVESKVHLDLLAENLIESGPECQTTIIDVRGLVAFIDDGELQLRMLQRIQFERGFSALRARSNRAAKRIEKPFGSIHVTGFQITVEEGQRLRNRQLISIAVVPRAAFRRKDIAASQDLAAAVRPGHLERAVIGQGLFGIKTTEQEVAAFGFALQRGREAELQT